MALNSLHDVYIDQLQDIHSACKQSSGVTRKLADAATDPSLKDALERGVEGIERGMDTLSHIIKGHDADPEGEHCKGMEGLVKEARAHGLEQDFGDSAAQDAMIITQYQRMAHYAIAGYGSCLAFARRMDHGDDVSKLEECLNKSYDGDRAMTDLATGTINKDAA
ncbi:ferritin-like domain-containing protein [uncultured Tateyamaria sp.]|uniref:YciE/YciF ferroxidase family protein n=1 Tax=uncultured Tateyamaria sp. TaxID=455651 RepID=UPI002619E978|nr:ferritin-like domain-containing protein [uncultured Tateyamaria sp.]